MLKASSLFYAIAMALIIALVSSSLILFAYFNRLQISSCLQTEKVQRNAGSGLNLLMSDQEIVRLNEKRILDLYETGNDSVTLEKKSWGLFEIDISTAFSSDKRNTQIVQVGSTLNSNQTALYLADQDKPLSLCGNTLIKGNCFLPKAGVKRAYIEGQSFSGDKLIDGIIKDSEREIPKINKELLERIGKTFMQEAVASSTEEKKGISTEEQQEKDTLTNSFEKNTMYIISNNPVRLDNKCYRGNITVISKKSIKVSATANLQDIILYAPQIEIEENFTGNIQAFATDTIILSKKCKLIYPSVIGLICNSKLPGNPLLIVKEDAEITGTVFAAQEDLSDLGKQVKVIIEKSAKVTGQVYTNGLLDLKGIVYGNIMCNRFILSTPSSMYENHLLNATIDNSKLSVHYVGIQLTEKIAAKKIAKWLY